MTNTVFNQALEEEADGTETDETGDPVLSPCGNILPTPSEPVYVPVMCSLLYVYEVLVHKEIHACAQRMSSSVLFM